MIEELSIFNKLHEEFNLKSTATGQNFLLFIVQLPSMKMSITFVLLVQL